MKTIRRILFGLCLLASLTLPTVAQADGLPAFIQVGRSYRELNGALFTVIEVDPTGWIRVRQAGKIFWLNLDRLSGLTEAE